MTPDKRVEEIVSNCVDCVYGMNIDCSMKEAKRLYTELENSPLLKKQITNTLTQYHQDLMSKERERINKILAGHGKGCDPRYHAECIEMIHEEVNHNQAIIRE